LTTALVWAPLLSLAVGSIGGVAVNLFTDDGPPASTPWMMLCMALAWEVARRGGLLLLRYSQHGTSGLAKTRYRLSQLVALRQPPVDPAAELAWIRRIDKVGQRLIQRRHLTVRQWAQHHEPRPGITVRWCGRLGLVGAGAAMVYLFPIFGLISGWTILPVVIAGGAGSAMLAARVGKRTFCWKMVMIGEELRTEACRAETAVLRALPRTADHSYFTRLRHWWTQRPRR
jgi:hypothetical protein